MYIHSSQSRQHRRSLRVPSVCSACGSQTNAIYIYIYVYLCISMYIYVYTIFSVAAAAQKSTSAKCMQCVWQSNKRYIYLYLCTSMYIYVHLCIYNLLSRGSSAEVYECQVYGVRVAVKQLLDTTRLKLGPAAARDGVLKQFSNWRAAQSLAFSTLVRSRRSPL